MAGVMSRSVPALLASLAALRSGLAVREVGLQRLQSAEEHVAHKSALESVSQENASQAAAADVHLGSRIDCHDEQWKEFKQMYRGDDGKPAKLNSMTNVQLDDRWWSQPNSKKFSFKSPCKSRNVVWLYPIWRGNDDKDQSYTVTRNTCYQLMTWANYGACHVRFERVESVQNAIDILSEYGDGALTHVAIGAYPVETNEKLKRLEFHHQAAACGTSKLCMDESGRHAGANPAFYTTLSAKLADYSTVFIDSARRGTPDASGQSWTQFLADQIGKGVRVYGSSGEYDKVEIVRVEEYYPRISNLRNGGLDNLQVESFAPTSPASTCSAAGGVDDKAWKCKCPSGTACRTKHGSLCPVENGLSSDVAFLSACASSNSETDCACKSLAKSGCQNEEGDDKSCCQAVPFTRKRRSSFGGLFHRGGHCKCVGTLQHANGKDSCAKAGSEHFAPEDKMTGCACPSTA
eukprot:TRINITY_DN10867_c0_g1_i1.p1 TRINITY_DN10867_c0_g1~~TRINITY_DN10867_c0_g1_i1.p1  ORF type:complete len:494 (+),score=82.81 TRINITY_DN10867_c0_g1_i1:98-1483(+)